ncbi:MAG: response regulator transcription factor [Chloroflexi bacterium]|nr:response regulator transcription factor [Chloroflexota bacterium]
MRQRVLVIDDDANITSFLRRALSYAGYEVLVARDGKTGLKRALEDSPDVVVLDVMMPEIDGLEVTRRLRAGGNTPVLMLTARDEVSDRVRGLDAGADDYLVKPFALEELTARIRALLRRREPDTAPVFRFADLTLDTTTREVRRGDRLVELTVREFELLKLLMRHPRQVLTRDLLLDRVWGFDADAETHVLEVYIGYLRQKLEASGEPRLIHTVRGVGYVLRE